MTEVATSSGAAPGSKTFVHGQVTSVLFNTSIPKRGGGNYQGTVLNYMDTQGQASSQKWAQQIIDDARNIELRNLLVQLHGAPGQQITIHKTKNERGFWNVDSIDLGYVEGVRTSAPAAPVAPGQPALPGAAPLPVVAGAVPAVAQATPLPVTTAPYVDEKDKKMRSKEQCMREAAVNAAAILEAGRNDGKQEMSRVLSNAEIILNYIVNGLAAPVEATPAVSEPALTAPAPTVAPAPAPAAAPAIATAGPSDAVATVPVPAEAVVPAPGPAPLPVITPPVATAPAVPAPAPAPAPVVSTAPPVVGAPAVVAQPGTFDDGFGGPGA